ncbi:ROK family protein [Cognatilysobacter bugurensis]|uniref:Glucokinase n=1 Tax=Cognatilysobacter bugurensis TaxID=543356 RepID=A0A918SYB6_9GAMM|nr:ROK family protein [Lysobacter bugurensis]GHA78952.1 glucokinase [Lysobacter bugurensis]
MAKRSAKKPAVSSTQTEHGSATLRRVSIDTYNSLVRDPGDAEFIGDRASETGFFAIFDRLRRTERTGRDAFGPRRGPDTDKTLVDHALAGGDPDAAHLVHLAVEEYAQGFADVIAFYLAQPAWQGVERIVIGGGFPDEEFGALAIRRTERILKRRRVQVEFHLLTQDADEGGLVGWVHAVPTPVTRGFDAFLAVDIGGTHVRCGIVEHGLRRAADGAKARVIDRMQWRHGSDNPSRDELVLRIAGMLNGLAAEARTIGVRLAPCVGIACPGRVEPDGSVPQGTQNLPGDWAPPFLLPRELEARLDAIDGQPPQVLMHNDAVIQGLGELHLMHDVARWAVLTIGTGLGNAVYTNR